MPHKRGTQSRPSKDFCLHIPSNFSGSLTSQITILLIIIWGVRDQKTPCNTKNELKIRMTASITNLNKVTFRKACRKFWSRLEAVVKANNDFLDKIWSIVFQSIFILVFYVYIYIYIYIYIYDKMICKRYFQFYVILTTIYLLHHNKNLLYMIIGYI